MAESVQVPERIWVEEAVVSDRFQIHYNPLRKFQADGFVEYVRADELERVRRETWDAAIAVVQRVIDDGKFGHMALAALKDAALEAAREAKG